jgi:hypothetical protein
MNTATYGSEAGPREAAIRDVLDRVRDWPDDWRRELAERVSGPPASVWAVSGPGAVPSPADAAPRRRAWTDLLGVLDNGDAPPDDATVRRWIDEARAGKYGR